VKFEYLVQFWNDQQFRMLVNIISSILPDLSEIPSRIIQRFNFLKSQLLGQVIFQYQTLKVSFIDDWIYDRKGDCVLQDKNFNTDLLIDSTSGLSMVNTIMSILHGEVFYSNENLYSLDFESICELFSFSGTKIKVLNFSGIDFESFRSDSWTVYKNVFGESEIYFENCNGINSLPPLLLELWNNFIIKCGDL